MKAVQVLDESLRVFARAPLRLLGIRAVGLVFSGALEVLGFEALAEGVHLRSLAWALAALLGSAVIVAPLVSGAQIEVLLAARAPKQHPPTPSSGGLRADAQPGAPSSPRRVMEKAPVLIATNALAVLLAALVAALPWGAAFLVFESGSALWALALFGAAPGALTGVWLTLRFRLALPAVMADDNSEAAPPHPLEGGPEGTIPALDWEGPNPGNGAPPPFRKAPCFD